MKASEWHALESRFTWCMDKETHSEEVDDWVLDFDAPKHLPDGEYDVICGQGDFSVLKRNSIEIKSGQFVPSRSTRGAIYLVGLCADLEFVDGLLEDKNLELNSKNLEKDKGSGDLLNNSNVMEGLWHWFLEVLDWNEEHEWFEASFGS